MEDLNILRQIPYFSHLEEKDLRVLAEVGHEEHYPEGSTIIEEGEVKNSLYFIVAGQVKVFLEKISGREVMLSKLQKGHLFGKNCLIGEKSPSPKVVSMEDTAVVRFEKDDFLHGISNDPVILANMLAESGFQESRDYEGEFEEENKFQREMSIFEKRFALELDGIKLISKKIEEISNETLSRVEKRTTEAIEFTEKRSKEVADHAEKEAAQAIESAKESIAKTLEEGKFHIEEAVNQVNAVRQSVKSETEAFWNNIKAWRKRIAIGIPLLVTVLGALGYHFGYSEFIKPIMELRPRLEKDKEVVDKVKQDVMKVKQDVMNENEKFRTKLPELSALNAMVLKIDRISKESDLMGDDLDRFKQANINYTENKKQLLHYVTSYEDEANKPQVVVEALASYLMLIDNHGDKIEEKDRNDILSSILRTLPRVKELLEKEQNFRYRLKNRDNIIRFGEILQKNYPDYYNDYFKPALIDFLPIIKFDDDAKFTLSEALVSLGERNQDCIDILTSAMNNEKRIWRRDGAAVALLHIKDQRAHDFLFAEMKPYKKFSEKEPVNKRLISALALGDAMARSNVIKLDKANQQILVDCIKEEIKDNPNKFQVEYANAILKKLEERALAQRGTGS